MAAMRTFNTAGPVVAADHYHIPPLERIDLAEVLDLIRDKKYFVLHAPRQTGKTSALLALRDLLNGDGARDYRCVYANVEAGQAMRENVAEGVRTVLAEIAFRASVTLSDDTLEQLWPDLLARVGAGQALRQALARWSMADPRPLVLLIDEIDTLIGDTLLSVLRQLRTGYDQRPTAFPHSIVLCGVRDVRDYRIHSTAENRMVLGGSAFNIKSESLRLGDFSAEEIRALLAQHARGDRTGVHGGGAGVDPHAYRRPAVAGERAVLRCLLPPQAGARPLAPDHGERHPGGTGAADPAP